MTIMIPTHVISREITTHLGLLDDVVDISGRFAAEKMEGAIHEVICALRNLGLDLHPSFQRNTAIIFIMARRLLIQQLTHRLRE